MKRAMILVAALALAGCSSGGSDATSPAKPKATTTTVPSRTIEGTIGGSDCYLLSPDGMPDGAPVVITDGAGKQLAVGEVVGDMPDKRDGVCAKTWRVKNVPEGASGYKVTVGKGGDPVEFTWYDLTHEPAITR